MGMLRPVLQWTPGKNHAGLGQDAVQSPQQHLSSTTFMRVSTQQSKPPLTACKLHCQAFPNRESRCTQAGILLQCELKYSSSTTFHTKKKLKALALKSYNHGHHLVPNHCMLKIGQLTRPIFPCGEKMVWERDKQDQRRH